jgi:hypothetical protein
MQPYSDFEPLLSQWHPIYGIVVSSHIFKFPFWEPCCIFIVKVEFKMNAVFVRYFGTHKEYDSIKASEA